MIPRQMFLRISSALGALVIFSLVFYYQHQSARFFTLKQPAADPPPPPNLLDHIDNSTFGFEKIFVVGLPSRTDRRDGMVLQAAVSDIEIEFIDGVRGDDVLNNAIPNAHKTTRPGSGTLGSWRAHMNAIQEWAFFSPFSL